MERGGDAEGALPQSLHTVRGMRIFSPNKRCAKSSASIFILCILFYPRIIISRAINEQNSAIPDRRSPHLPRHFIQISADSGIASRLLPVAVLYQCHEIPSQAFSILVVMIFGCHSISSEVAETLSPSIDDSKDGLMKNIDHKKGSVNKRQHIV